ncbi:M56 family metallopeptidase [Microscilla marina]|uniref:TonB domain/peptidase M56 domain protein, putative n=1 Tax=Microscilla marina ATCC 23134 TaxID=313606 RepID=A1ZPU6_MICM2|nr:M56 family metallopeptidase [Microscilla marina]EAY27601.1 TonB domain/peptidase M56 domain protein, putative [Microscilla marina ATCC 23134]
MTQWIQNLIPARLIDALGWTLIHSLWQGAVLAIVLVVALILLRKNSSRLRYFVATSALFTLALVATITFVSLYQAGAPVVDKAIPAKMVQAQLPLVQQVSVASGKNLTFFSNYFNQHLPLIVTAWLLGVLVLMLRFLGGFAYLQRLRHHQTKAVSNDWQVKVLEIADNLKIKKVVRLLESGMAKTPMVIGHLKPMILLPLGTIGGLSAQQVESILAHEIAHITRNDYLVNILQSVFEIVLFFNPAMWWISARVREERENCCDDIALQLTNDRLTLVKTLATLEEMRIGAPQNAVAFAGKKGGLVGRIQRIINSPRTNATFSEGFVAALLMVGFLSLASFYVRTEPTIAKVQATQSHSVTGTTTLQAAVAKLPLPTPKPTNDTIRFGKFMIVTLPGKKVVVYKNGKKLQPEDYDKYTKDFAINDQKIRIGEQGKSPIIIAVDPTERKPNYSYDYDLPTPPSPPTPPSSVHIDHGNSNRWFRQNQNGKDVSIHYGDHWEVTKLVVNGKTVAPKDYPKYQKDIAAGKRNFEKNREEQRRRRTEQRRHHRGLNEHKRELRKHRREHRRELRRQAEQHRRTAEQHRRVASQHRNVLKKVIEEMKKDKIIPADTRNYTLKMKKGEIVINGKKLNKTQYKKYRQFVLEVGGVDIDKKGSSWNWVSTHNED